MNAYALGALIAIAVSLLYPVAITLYAKYQEGHRK